MRNEGLKLHLCFESTQLVPRRRVFKISEMGCGFKRTANNEIEIETYSYQVLDVVSNRDDMNKLRPMANWVTLREFFDLKKENITPKSLETIQRVTSVDRVWVNIKKSEFIV